YVPGSHRADLTFVDIFRKAGAGAELMAGQATEPVFVPCRPGDVLFHSGRTIHLAKPNRSARMRRAYTAIYFKDGCTRGHARPPPSVARARTAIGAPLAGGATPVVWPIDGYPEPAPWPAGDARTATYRRLGVIPGA